MHPSRPLPLLLAALLTAAPALAAKKPDPNLPDVAPQLISTKGGGPKWKTVEQLKQFAAKGDPQACLELGNRCLEGEGVPKDVSQAAKLFDVAAKAGLPDAWFKLGKISHDGLTGAPDYARALECFTTAAHAGLVEAQHNLGAMLVSARGVKRNYVEGLAWLIVASKGGDPSDAEKQVRGRLAKRPADLAAAEARAKEIAADLEHATVNATLPGSPPPPHEVPPPAAPAPKPPIVPVVEKPAPGAGLTPAPLTAPTLEPIKLDLPAPKQP